MADESAHVTLDQQRKHVGLSIEDCWTAYFAMGGHATLVSLRAFLNGGPALPQIEVAILTAAIRDLTLPASLTQRSVAIQLSETLGTEPATSASSGSDGIIQLIAEHLGDAAGDSAGPTASWKPVVLTDVKMLIRSGRTTTVRTALPPCAEPGLLGPSPSGSLLRVGSATAPEWEMHSSGDELLVLLSGAAQIEIDRPISITTQLQRPFEACVIPKGRWHRHQATSPDTKVIFLTPTESDGA